MIFPTKKKNTDCFEGSGREGRMTTIHGKWTRNTEYFSFFFSLSPTKSFFLSLSSSLLSSRYQTSHQDDSIYLFGPLHPQQNTQHRHRHNTNTNSCYIFRSAVHSFHPLCLSLHPSLVEQRCPSFILSPTHFWSPSLLSPSSFHYSPSLSLSLSLPFPLEQISSQCIKAKGWKARKVKIRTYCYWLKAWCCDPPPSGFRMHGRLPPSCWVTHNMLPDWLFVSLGMSHTYWQLKFKLG